MYKDYIFFLTKLHKKNTTLAKFTRKTIYMTIRTIVNKKSENYNLFQDIVRKLY